MLSSLLHVRDGWPGGHCTPAGQRVPLVDTVRSGRDGVWSHIGKRPASHEVADVHLLLSCHYRTGGSRGKGRDIPSIQLHCPPAFESPRPINASIGAEKPD